MGVGGSKAFPGLEALLAEDRVSPARSRSRAFASRTARHAGMSAGDRGVLAGAVCGAAASRILTFSEMPGFSVPSS